MSEQTPATPAPAPAETAAPLTRADINAAKTVERRVYLRWWAALAALLLMLVCVGGVAVRYLLKPEPLPAIVPVTGLNQLPPHYLFSIYGVDQPVGVALAPDGQRLYVAETGGERLVKIFNRAGQLQGQFAAPRTALGERAPVYLAVDAQGRVFVSDRMQRAVMVYAADGVFLDSLLTPDLSLSEYVAKHTGGLPAGTRLAYNQFQGVVVYQKPGEPEQTLPAPEAATWAPLGLRFNAAGDLLVTDVEDGRSTVRVISAAVIQAANWQTFDAPGAGFGATGQENGEFRFPNSALADSQGRLYVMDGNNGRISVWNAAREFLFHFGKGTGSSALNLPRGAVLDSQDRLHVVDAVGQDVKVYDVSGPTPQFLYAFGEMGLGDGQFNYPNDIALDTAWRLYIADRENNRLQVWSY